MTAATKRKKADPLDCPGLIADRYRVEGLLGQGGMAAVYRVTDILKQEEKALKRPLMKGQERLRQETERAFENEFHTLAQLAHPRVVEVYDYGVAEGVPFYTMELLSGGDLKSLSPMPWRKVCSLLRDVCSVLSLLHSRRQVHRDLTTRNIRCTRDGTAKLFDFGAMRPMGPCKTLVGTPSFTPPEAVNLLTLEERTDLFSLGATAYYLLTGRHAYPARSFKDLREIWRSHPVPPSAVLERSTDPSLSGIPEELDNLVMSMLRLSSIARPANAAEVIEKLSAMAGLGSDEQLHVSNTYLSTPTLIGRNKELNFLRKQMLLTRLDYCGTTLIEGASGMGRSRFLEAHILEAKLAGSVVVRVHASDAYAGPYGGAKAMISGLKDTLPPEVFEACEPLLNRAFEEMPDLDVLQCRHADAEVTETREALPPADEPQSEKDVRARVQQALCAWLRDIGRRLLLMIAVDDVDKLDEPSAAFFAFLSREIRTERLMLSVTAEAEAPGTSEVAMQVFRSADTRICLEPLNPEQTEALFTSVFGKVPNVRLLSDRIHTICKGNPRDALQLARHLVDKELIRYHSGAWSLPANIDPGDLPLSMSQALEEQMAGLGETARWIIDCMSLDPDESFSLAELLALSGFSKNHFLMPHLNELLAVEVLTVGGDRYRLRQKSVGSALRSHMGEEREKALRLRLAEMFETQRGDRFRMSQHLLWAGEEQRAIALLAESSEVSHEQTAQDVKAHQKLTQSLPRDWFDTFEGAIAQAKRRNYPSKQIYELQNRFLSLSGTGIVAGSGFAPHYLEILEQLYRMTGLDIYHELDDSMDPAARLSLALELAQKRFDETPEGERVLAPTMAIRRLGRTLITAASYVAVSYDYGLWEALPSLSPLAPLSPAVGIIEKLVQSMGARLAARDEVVRRSFLDILELTEDPKRAGLDETYRRVARGNLMRGLGFIEAAMGFESSLAWADEIESDPSQEVNAWRIRVCYHLWQGNATQAEICARSVEKLQIQNAVPQWYEGAQLHRELVAYALADDLGSVKQSVDAVAKMAAIYDAWKPTLHYARGQYQRIRGHGAEALREFETALKMSAPGRHRGWANFAGAYVGALLKQSREREAVQRGRAFLKAADEEDLGYMRIYIQMPLAEAEASLGYCDDAMRNADAVVETVGELGGAGLNAMLAHENRAKVALMLGDKEGCEAHARRCSEQIKKGASRGLIDKYENLISAARDGGMDVSRGLQYAVERTDDLEERIVAEVGELLSGCRNGAERCQRAIDFLVDVANCSGGFLYLVRGDGVVLAARNGANAIPDALQSTVEADIARERAAEILDSTATLTATEEATREQTLTHPADASEMVSQQTGDFTGANGENLYPMILGHHEANAFVISGEAVLVADPQKRFRPPAFLASTVSKVLGNPEVDDICEDLPKAPKNLE